MLESLLALFAVGTWAFWIVMATVILLVVWLSEEEGTKATFVLIAGALGLQFIAKVDLFAWIKDKPFTLLAYAGVYVVIGLAWAFVKWHFYAQAQRRKYDVLRAEFCRQHGIAGDFTYPEKEKWLKCLADNCLFNKKSSSFHHFSSSPVTALIPDVTENKAAIIRWMTYWPFSVTFTLLNDPVRRLFEWIYESFGKTLQDIANRAFRGTEKDLLTEAERTVEGNRQRQQLEDERRQKAHERPSQVDRNSHSY